jgi:translation initiation factor IF-2
VEELKVIGRIDLDALNQKTRPAKKSRKEREKERKERRRQKTVVTKPEEKTADKPKEKISEGTGKKDEIIKAKAGKLNGPTVVGKIDLPEKKAGAQKDTSDSTLRKRRRKRIKESGRIKFEDKPGEKGRGDQKLQKPTGKKKKVLLKKRWTKVKFKSKLKIRWHGLTSKGKSKGSKHRRDKRAAASEKQQADQEKQSQDKKILKATEFVSVNELANMMNVNVNEVISSCMSLGLFVSINQRLDAETLSIVAEEFGYKVEFVSADLQDSFETDRRCRGGLKTPSANCNCNGPC